VSRTGGTRGVLPYEKTALKDVVWLNKNEKVEVLARYGPWDGLYMFHCHNLIHEDHDMMAALNVTALKDLGYDEKTSFIDPMEPKYRAKSFSKDDLENRGGDFSDDAINKKCKQFQDMDAYKHANEAEEKLEEYWKTATRKTQTTLQTSVSSSGASSAAVVASSSSSGSSVSAASVAPSVGSTLVTSASSVKPSSSTDKSGKKTTSSSSAAAVKSTTKRK
jgi:bilirubin oxidase